MPCYGAVWIEENVLRGDDRPEFTEKPFAGGHLRGLVLFAGQMAKPVAWRMTTVMVVSRSDDGHDIGQCAKELGVAKDAFDGSVVGRFIIHIEADE